MLGHRKLEVSEYVSILKRRFWLIAIPLVVLPIVTTGLTYLIPPMYMSQTLVLIDQQKVPDEYVKPVIGADLDTRLSSMKEQIMSRSRIQPIIERYNLYGTMHISMDDKIEMARKGISIKAIQSQITRAGGLPGFFISFVASDPHTAQLVCGEITTLFVNENLQAREASAEGTTDFLKGQLDDAKRSLDEQDKKLADFQRQYVGKLPGESGENLNMLTSLNTQLEAANQSLARMEQDRTYMQTMLSSVAPGVSIAGTPSLAPLTQTMPNPLHDAKEAELTKLQNEEAELTEHYTADYPDVVSIRRRIEDMRKQIAALPATVAVGSATSSTPQANPVAVNQLRAQLHAAEVGIAEKRREQEQIQTEVRTYQERISATPMVEEQYKELTRDYDNAKGFYDDLLTKMNHSKMATALEHRQEGEQFRVMDQPNLPDSPFSPKRGVYTAGGLLGGLAIGLLVSAFLEFRDTALRTEADVWAFTRLPTLAVIAMVDMQGKPIKPEKPEKPEKQERRFFRRGKAVKDATAEASG